jgi:hypothetical protein
VRVQGFADLVVVAAEGHGKRLPGGGGEGDEAHHFHRVVVLKVFEKVQNRWNSHKCKDFNHSASGNKKKMTRRTELH